MLCTTHAAMFTYNNNTDLRTFMTQWFYLAFEMTLLELIYQENVF